jgi:hypothetical protein
MAWTKDCIPAKSWQFYLWETTSGKKSYGGSKGEGKGDERRERGRETGHFSIKVLDTRIANLWFQRKIQALKNKRAAKEEKARYEKLAETMHRKRVERLKRKEKRNKMLKSWYHFDFQSGNFACTAFGGEMALIVFKSHLAEGQGTYARALWSAMAYKASWSAPNHLAFIYEVPRLVEWHPMLSLWIAGGQAVTEIKEMQATSLLFSHLYKFRN